MQQSGFKIPSNAMQRAWIALHRATPQIMARVEAALAAANMPNLQWYSVLWGLERAGGQARPRDIGEWLFLERYSVSRLIERLEADGLIERLVCPEDARGFHVHLTKKGKSLRLAMWSIYAPAMAEALSPITEQEAATLKSILDKLG